MNHTTITNAAKVAQSIGRLYGEHARILVALAMADLVHPKDKRAFLEACGINYGEQNATGNLHRRS